MLLRTVHASLLGLLLFAESAAAGRDGAATAPTGRMSPFTAPVELAQVQGEERRVWSQSEDLVEALQKGGLVYDDPQITAYVQGVAERLYPEFSGSVRLRILKLPHLNAFALPNGSIFINQGLLDRFQNEAQLAAVLAHEAVHFTYRHGYQGQQNLKDTAAFASIVGMFGIYGLLPQLLASSSMYGFSREMETQADTEGYARLARAGYDVHEAPKVFEHLMAEIKAEDIKEPFFFATHPRLAERAANMKKLSANAPPGGDGSSRSDYSRVMLPLRLSNLDNMLSMGRAKSALIVLQDAQHLADLPPYAPYYLGEAYRLRAQDGDNRLAEQAYLRAIDAAADFAPSYRALGVLYMKTRQYAAAERYLGRYLELAPDAKDRKHVESYLRTARKRGQP